MNAPILLRREASPALGPVERNSTAATHGSLNVVMVAEAAAGGVAVHLADLLRGLVMRGVDVHLIAPQAEDRFDTQLLNNECLALCRSATRLPLHRSIGLHDISSFAQIYKAIEAVRPDIVHAHSSKAGVLARACFGAWRTVYTPHAVYTLNPTLRAASRCLFGAIEGAFGRWLNDRIIAVSDDEARHLHEDLWIPRERIETIWNGVPSFERMTRTDARRRLGLSDDVFVVGMVGRFAFQKGIDRLVEVARKVGEKSVRRVEFVCIGTGDFASASGADGKTLPSNLTVAGALPDARRYFDAFDVFALPSRYEGFPYVYLEAVASGVPIVSTHVAGADALVTKHNTGVVVPNSDDVTPFADAIVSLASDSTHLAELRQNCAAAAAHFTSERMIDQTLALYRQCLNK
jgi:glycosyltransferase involved in cell wall biosynthesis